MIFNNRIKEICKNHKKVALFVDMDGTIVEYNVYPEGYITNQVKDIFLKANPIKVVLDKLKEVGKIENLDIYILSLAKSNKIIEEKKAWLKRFAPFINEEKYIILCKENLEYNPENRKYVKGKKMKEMLDKYDYVMLLDDEHNILKETQKELKENGEVFHVSSAII